MLLNVAFKPDSLRALGTCLCVVGGLVFLVPAGAAAQDAHYWTLTYGSRASLLGGAVIGSVMDLSATYYNPGALPLIEDIEVVMTSTVFQYPNVWMRNVAGTGADFKSSRASQAPVVVAGMFKVNWHGANRIGYSVLTRQRIELDFHGHLVSNALDIPDTIPVEALTGDLNFSEDISETWVGLCWGRGLTGGIGLGVTAYATFRDQRAAGGVVTEALREDDRLAHTRNTSWYSFSDYRVLLKLGAMFTYRGTTWGLTLTTPSLGVYSDAQLGVNKTVSRYDVDGGGAGDTYLAGYYRDGLKASYKMPLSIGIGLNHEYRNTAIHLSGEYFFPVDRYYVIEAGDFTGQTDGDTLDPSITHEAKGVFNVAVGLEHSFTEKYRGYLSFYTDFSARKEGTDTNLSITDWDIYTVMLGSNFSVGGSRFTLGLGLGWGSNTSGTGEPVEIGNGEEINLLRQAGFEYRSYKFVLGFSF